MKKLIIAAVCVAAFVSCKDKKDKTLEKTSTGVVQTVTEDKNEGTTVITLNLEPKSDSKSSGTVTFTEKDGIVTMEFVGKGFEPGEHAIHIHEKADCSSPDGKSTGGHWNPTFEDHGKWGNPPYHKGDIGNFTADADGNASLTFQTDEWCIGCDDKNKDILGKAVIIHDGVDDFVSQPTGNAGGRINCAAIIE